MWEAIPFLVLLQISVFKFIFCVISRLKPIRQMEGSDKTRHASPGRRKAELSEPVVIERRSNCLVVRLNRPASLNAFTVGMHQALLAAIASAKTDPQLRSVVLTGAGRAFCAGQDLQESMAADGPISDLGEHLDRFYNPLIRALRDLPIPVIAAVNGVAAGAGASLAFACDIVVAARSARFVQSFSKIGLVPDSGATWTLPRLVGPLRARAMTLLGEPLDAQTALAWGLVWSVVDDDALLDAALAVADRLAALPPTGLALTKQALDAAMEVSLDRQLDTERDLQSKAGASADHREAVRAFVEKRAPVFASGSTTS